MVYGNVMFVLLLTEHRTLQCEEVGPFYLI